MEKKKKYMRKAKITITIKDKEDIIIEKMIKDYDELKKGNDEIYLLQQMYGRDTWE